ncbi:hypothetical protein ACN47E_005358 [Coniothyrium glycines]
MASPTKRMTPPASTTVPTPTGIPRTTLPDIFIDLIQGPAIPISVGQGPAARNYVIPVGLLTYHSVYFRQEILRLSTLVNANKKRKLSPDDAAEAHSKTDNTARTATTTEEGNTILRFPTIDPRIFALFLRFIYQGQYPLSYDARLHHPNTTTTTTMTPPTTLEPIPPCILAWLLAQRLSALPFMNHATIHIYNGIGVHFALTPDLVRYIWTHTTPGIAFAPASPSPSPSPYPSQSPSPCLPPPQPLSPSPLRTLTLHLLLAYWDNNSTTPTPTTTPGMTATTTTAKPAKHATTNKGPSAFIAKFPALNQAWDDVFAAFPDLRLQFIIGLQGVRRMLPVQAYLAVPVPVQGAGGAAAAAAVGVKGGAETGGGNAFGGAKGGVEMQVEVKQEEAGGEETVVKVEEETVGGSGLGGEEKTAGKSGGE